MKLTLILPILLLSGLTIISSVLACSTGPYYTGFTLLEQNSTAPHDRFIKPGEQFQLFDPVTNATITATPTKPNTAPWILKMLGFKQEDSNDIISSVPVVSGITDDKGFVMLPTYHTVKYNLTIQRENKSDYSLLIYPSENDYTLYLGD
jgi:hypothetical protein